jgi:hypothetical protein
LQGNTGVQGIQGVTGPAGPSNVVNASAVTTNATFYPVFVAGTGNQTPSIRTAATEFSFNASTSNLMVGGNLTAAKLVPTGNVTAGNGMYLPAANTLAFSTNGSERLRIDANGKVGIGSTSPSTKLTIRGNSTSGTTSQTNISAFTNNGIRIEGVANPLSSQDAISYQSAGGGGGAAISFGRGGTYNTFISFYTCPSNGTTGEITERMRIVESGNVGIGLTAPNVPLEVAGNIHVSGGDRTIYNRSNNFLAFGTNNTERMRILAGGNVGIGTSSPGRALHVSTASASIFTLERTSGTSSALLLEAGSNYTALYSRATDTNTSSREFRVYLGSSQSATLTSDGNFGLGINNPTYKLDVFGSSRVNSLTLDVITGSTVPKIIFKTSGGALTPDITLNSYTTASSSAESGYGILSIEGSQGQLMSITDQLQEGTIFSVNDIAGLPLIEAEADGNVYLVRFGENVGIGLTSPNERLEVNGNIHVSGGDRTIFNRSNNFLAFGTNNTERIRILAGGNVGIGTSSPGRTLHVSTASASVFTLERTSGTSSALLLEAGSNYTALYSRAADNNTATRELRFLIGNTQAAKITTSRDLEISEKLLFDTSSSSTGVLTLQGYHNSGAIVSINDSSGIPLMEFDSDKNIYANRFGGEFFLDGDVYQKDAPLYAFPPVAAITGSSFTLPYTGIGYYYRLTNSAGCTITVPNVTFPTGSEFYFRAAATGALSLVKGAGVSINNEALISGIGQHDNFVLKAVNSLEWDII